MIYQDGDLLKFSPFAFKNGDQPKTKYFIVLGHIDDKLLMACLPTSKDHVPADAMVERDFGFVPKITLPKGLRKFADRYNFFCCPIPLCLELE